MEGRTSRSSESIGGEASISVRRSISYPNPIPSYVVLPRSAAVTSFIHVCVRAGGREREGEGGRKLVLGTRARKREGAMPMPPYDENCLKEHFT